MLNIYYGIPSVKSTLNLFECLWDYVDRDIEEKLVEQLIYKYRFSSSKRFVIKKFISKKLLSSENQQKWNNFIANM